MEEVHIRSANLEEEPGSGGSIKEASRMAQQQETIQKIYRKGDKVYQLMDENITMLKDGPPQKTSSDQQQEPVDEIASGESLFKTFTFDNAISKEETEKCLTFWRSVVEKNLEPIKCTLIENMTKSNQTTEKKESANSSRKKSRTKTKQSSRDATTNKDTLTKGKPKKNVWYEILEELQRKRLNETKLKMEKKCRFCDFLKYPPYQQEDTQKQDKEAIEELDKWEPKSYHKNGSKFVKKSLRSSLVLKGKQSTSNDSPKLNEPITEGPIIEEVDEKDTTDELRLKTIKSQSNKFKYIDAIKTKKELGVYSKWRRNRTELCDCRRSECDCNKNPAIKKFSDASKVQTKKSSPLSQVKSTAEQKQLLCDQTRNTMQEKGQESTSFDVDNPKEIVNKLLENQLEVITKSQANRSEIVNPTEEIEKADPSYTEPAQTQLQNEVSVDSKPKLDKPSKSDSDFELSESSAKPSVSKPKRSILISEEDSLYGNLATKFKHKRSLRKSISVVVSCICSSVNCDCKEKIIAPEKPVLSTEEIDLPKAPTRKSIPVQRVNSLELIKKRMSVVTFPSNDEVKDTEVENEKPITGSSSARKLRNSIRSHNSLELAKIRLSKTNQTFNEPSDVEDTRKRNVSMQL